jgi:hypothetical protein
VNISEFERDFNVKQYSYTHEFILNREGASLTKISTFGYGVVATIGAVGSE